MWHVLISKCYSEIELVGHNSISSVFLQVNGK